jgi:hypothetical protein
MDILAALNNRKRTGGIAKRRNLDAASLEKVVIDVPSGHNGRDRSTPNRRSGVDPSTMQRASAALRRRQSLVKPREDHRL